MAGVNEIQVGRINAILHKLLGMGEGAPAPSLAPEIVATLGLELDRPEWAYLGGVRWCGATASKGSVAGQYSGVGIVNPPGSGVLAVLQSFEIMCGPASVSYTCLVGGINSYITFSPVAQGSTLDIRNALPGGALTSSAVYTWEEADALIAGYPIYTAKVLNNWSRTFRFPVVLPPDSAFGFYADTVAYEAYGSFIWTERPLEPSEVR